MLAHFGGDLTGDARAPVEHRDEHAEDLQLGIETLAHQGDGVEELGEPLEGVVLGLYRDEHLARRHEGVHGENAERRRAVDEDELVVVELSVEGLSEDDVAAVDVDQLGHGAGEVGARRDEVEPGHGGRHGDLAPPPPRRPAPRTSDRPGSTSRTPSPADAFACGSRSTSRTRTPASARQAARLIAVVVLPTPPFWLVTATMRVTSGLPWQR